MKMVKTLPAVLRHEGRSATSDDQKAHLLNTCFCSKFTQPSDPTEPFPQCNDSAIGTLNSLEVSPFRVSAILSSLDRTKSCGADGLSSMVLLQCADALAIPLTKLFTKCISSGKYPQKWKEANIIPIHKKGRTDLALNYRSVSLLPIVSKVFEKILLDGFVNHIRPIIADAQHGFVSNRSCITNLGELMAYATTALKEKLQLEIIYTDFSGAFQSVDHRLLLHKLEATYGISGPLLALFKSYLTNRRQRVLINGCTSGWSPAVSGVPEGSLLGPSLFLAFINDLPDIFRSPSLLYCDDLKIFRTIRGQDDATLLQSDLDSLQAWTERWKLKLCSAKCFHFRITLKKQPIPLRFTISGSQLDLVGQIRDLGVILDTQLTFANHIDSAVKRGNRALGLLIRSVQGIRGNYDKTGLLAAYYANVRSILEYGSVVWAGAAKSHLDRLERIQHKFLMFLAGTRRDDLNVLNYNELCARYNVQKLSKRRSALDLSFLHGLFNGRIDSKSLVERFSLRVPARQTRSNELFALTNPRVSVCNASLFFRLPRVMNSLLTSRPTLDLFSNSRREILSSFYASNVENL